MAFDCADMFKGQWTDKVTSLLEKRQGKMAPVPQYVELFSTTQQSNDHVGKSC